MRYLNSIALFLCMFGLATSGVAENNRSEGSSGRYVTLKQNDGSALRIFVAGPEDSNAAVVVAHDYFGLSDATRESVEHLGALGYRAVAVDLYDGRSATNHEEAVKLMQSLDQKTTDKILQSALDYLKRPGRKVATLGFSMGAQQALIANLNDPNTVGATVMIYGAGYDKIETKRLERLKSCVLVITGGDDNGATEAAIKFVPNMREANRQLELFVYPGADHGYAQPLFNGGKNYNSEAIRMTWTVAEDFLSSHLHFHPVLSH